MRGNRVGRSMDFGFARTTRRAASALRMGVILSVALTAACTGGRLEKPIEGGPVDTGAGTLAAARKYLEGRWSLESFQIVPAGQPPMPLTGSGTLSYDGFGNLAMELRLDRASAEALDRAGMQSDNGVISMTGRTTVDMKARTLTYFKSGQPTLVAPTGPLGITRPRHWEVTENILTLTTKHDDGQTASVGRWKRMP